MQLSKPLFLLAAIVLRLSFSGAYAADQTIDQLTAGATLGGTEKLPMFQGSNPAVNTTPSAIAVYINNNRNLWGGENYEQGCVINPVGTPGTFTPNCAVNYITVSATGQTIAAPAFTIPTGANPSLVRKSIELVISYSGTFTPGFAANGYGWSAGAAPVACSSGVTAGCLSSASGSKDWIECRTDATAHVGCAPPLTAMQGYTGPCDVAGTGAMWWGLRACGSANLSGTTKAINIRRATGGTSDIVILNTGQLDTATAASFCAATTCFITKFYDQTGHALDMAQATTTLQPQLIFNCLGTTPCARFNGTTQYLAVTTTATVQPISFAAVAERTSTTGFESVIAGNASGPAEMGFAGTAGNMYIYAGNAVQTEPAAEAVFHALIAVENDTSSAINVDGSDFPTLASSPGTSGLSTSTLLGARTAGTENLLTGNIIEAGVWTSALTSATRTALSANAHSAYGF